MRTRKFVLKPEEVEAWQFHEQDIREALAQGRPLPEGLVVATDDGGHLLCFLNHGSTGQCKLLEEDFIIYQLRYQKHYRISAQEWTATYDEVPSDE